MNAIQATILGLVQGLTEFLPVSSSGHLILARDIMRLPLTNSLVFDAILHIATALAVIIYFRKELGRLCLTFYALILRRANIDPTEKTLFWAIIIGALPAAIIGAVWGDAIEGLLRGTVVVVVTLLLGSVLFVVAEKFRRETETLTKKRGFIIGLFQLLAFAPGFSRSGSTISGGLLLGMKRDDAARFSFLMGLPIMLGAGGVQILHLFKGGAVSEPIVPLTLAFVFAFASGLFAIHWLLKFLKANTLYSFVWYRVILAILITAWFFL
jgi:undecaprenyl-diphosphatase